MNRSDIDREMNGFDGYFKNQIRSNRPVNGNNPESTRKAPHRQQASGPVALEDDDYDENDDYYEEPYPRSPASQDDRDDDGTAIPRIPPAVASNKTRANHPQDYPRAPPSSHATKVQSSQSTHPIRNASYREQERDEYDSYDSASNDGSSKKLPKPAILINPSEEDRRIAQIQRPSSSSSGRSSASQSQSHHSASQHHPPSQSSSHTKGGTRRPLRPTVSPSLLAPTMLDPQGNSGNNANSVDTVVSEAIIEMQRTIKELSKRLDKQDSDMSSAADTMRHVTVVIENQQIELLKQERQAKKSTDVLRKEMQLLNKQVTERQTTYFCKAKEGGVEVWTKHPDDPSGGCRYNVEAGTWLKLRLPPIVSNDRKGVPHHWAAYETINEIGCIQVCYARLGRVDGTRVYVHHFTFTPLLDDLAQVASAPPSSQPQPQRAQSVKSGLAVVGQTQQQLPEPPVKRKGDKKKESSSAATEAVEAITRYNTKKYQPPAPPTEKNPKKQADKKRVVDTPPAPALPPPSTNATTTTTTTTTTIKKPTPLVRNSTATATAATATTPVEPTPITTDSDSGGDSSEGEGLNSSDDDDDGSEDDSGEEEIVYDESDNDTTSG